MQLMPFTASRFGVLALITAAAAWTPDSRAESAWQPQQEFRISSSTFTQPLVVQYTLEGGVYNSTGGEIAFGDRAVAYGWNPLSLSGVFIYDYAETRFTLAAWGLPANLE